MKFRKFGKTVLTAALSSAIVISLSSCVRSFTVGYLYVTGTLTSTPSGNGIISGYKIDNNTGKLVAMHGLPVSSGGANPVRAVLLSGGRFVYVLNQGTTASGGSVCTTADPCQNSNITQFVVGGNGILTPEATFYTQGINPFRLISDSSGNFLLALDHDAPSGAYCGTIVTGATTCGDITVFAINSTTGRLSLVTNSQLTTSTGSQVTYFPVPADPIDFVLDGYASTLSGAPGTATGQTVYPYGYNTTTGQLTVSQSAPQIINNGTGAPMTQGRAIEYQGSKVYILDNESLTATVNGTSTTSSAQIIPFTVGTNGALQALTGGAVPDDPAEEEPLFLILDHTGKWLYVANEAGAGADNGAGIAQFTIATTNEFTESSGSPYGTGTGARCLLEDPSYQYMYTANTDGTVTGKFLDANTGSLKIPSGWTGQITLPGPATYCFVNGRTN